MKRALIQKQDIPPSDCEAPISLWRVGRHERSKSAPLGLSQIGSLAAKRFQQSSINPKDSQGVLAKFKMNLCGSELFGVYEPSQPLVGHLATAELVELWERAAPKIVKYGFAIEFSQLEPPRTGTFDARRIVIEPDVGLEMQCFILLHLFGHSVQWVAPSLDHKLEALQNTSQKERFLDVLHDHEFEAAQFGLSLLYEVGVTHLKTWFSDLVATDRRYVERYYCEDKKDSALGATGQPLVHRLSISPRKYRLVQVRFAF